MGNWGDRIKKFLQDAGTTVNNIGQGIGNAIQPVVQGVQNAAPAFGQALVNSLPPVAGFNALQSLLIQSAPQSIGNWAQQNQPKSPVDYAIPPFMQEYGKALGQSLLNTTQNAIQLSPGYQAISGLLGHPVNPLQATLNTGLSGLNTAYRASGLAPLLGSTFGAIQGLRKTGNFGGLLSGAMSGPAEQPFVGEAVTSNPETAGKINLAMIPLTLLHGGIKSIRGGGAVSALDKNAILDNASAENVGNLLTEFEKAGQFSVDALHEARKVLVDNTKLVTSKEFQNISDSDIYASLKNLLTKNQDYAYRQLPGANALVGNKPTQPTGGVPEVNPTVVTPQAPITPEVPPATETPNLRSNFLSDRNVRLGETGQTALSIDKILPDKTDREALSLFTEIKDNPDLQTRLQALVDSGKVPKEYQQAAIRALDPANAQRYAQADALQTAYYNGRQVEGKGLGYIKGDIKNYITHIGVTGDNGEPLTNVGKGSPMTLRTQYGQGRGIDTATGQKNTFVSLFEKGMKPATLNASDIMRIYGSKDAIANASAKFVSDAKSAEMGGWFHPDEIPNDWTGLDPYGRHFQHTLAVTGADGQPVKVTQVFAVPNKIADAMKPVIEPDWLKKVGGIGKWRMAQSWAKYVNLSLSFFHAKALTITANNSMGPIEAAKALLQNMDSPTSKANELDLLKAGGTTPVLGGEYNAYRNIQRNGQNILTNNPITNAFNALAKKTSGITFDGIQRPYKVWDYSTKVASWLANHPQATDAEVNGAKEKIATYVNDAYGGLNWEKMGFSKSGLTLLRSLFLAPDWTFSNLAMIPQAIKGTVPVGQSAKFIVASFATGIAMTQATNMFLNGKPSSDPFNVTLGYRKDGTEVKANVFFAGTTKDLVSLFTKGPIEFATSKAAPFMRTLLEEGTNKDYFGNPIRNPGKGVVGNIAATAGHLAGGLPIPFMASAPFQLLTGANRAGSQPLPAELALAATGMGQITTKNPTRDAYKVAYDNAIGAGQSDLSAQLAGINAEKSVKTLQTTGQLEGQPGKEINAAANNQVQSLKDQKQLMTDLKAGNQPAQSPDLLTSLKNMITGPSTPKAQAVAANYPINGVDTQGYTLNGKFFYNDPDTGDQKSTTLTTIQKQTVADQVALQNAQYALDAQRYLRANNLNGWVNATQNQIQSLENYQANLDPVKDQTKAITVQNTIEDLKTNLAKYKSYGGFKKGRKPPGLTLTGLKNVGKLPKRSGGSLKVKMPKISNKQISLKAPAVGSMKSFSLKGKPLQLKNTALHKPRLTYKTTL